MPLRCAPLLLLALLTHSPACRSGVPAAPAVPPHQPAHSRRAQELRIRLPVRLSSTDCVLRGDPWCDRVLRDTVYEPLLRWDPQTSRYVGWLATAWSRRDGGRTVEITLRKGVRWHDGTPLMAKHVRSALLALAARRPAENPGEPPLLAHFRRVLLSVRYSTPRVVELRFSRPFGPLLPLLATLPILRTPATLPKTEEPALRVVGTGPFRLVQWWPEDRIVLARWRKYWHTPPRLARIAYRVLPRLLDAEAAFRSGALDLLLDLDPRSYRRARRRLAALGPVPVRAEHAAFSALVLNPSRPPLQDRRVREAILRGFDRRALARTMPGGPAALLPGPVWRHGPQARGLRDPWPPAADFATAARLLWSAGWRRLPTSLYRKGGRPLQVEVLTARRSQTFNRWLRRSAAAFRRHGILLRARRIPWPHLVARVARGRFQAAAWVTRLDGPWSDPTRWLPFAPPRAGAPVAGGERGHRTASGRRRPRTAGHPQWGARFRALAHLVEQVHTAPNAAARRRREHLALRRLAHAALLLPLHAPRVLGLARCSLPLAHYTANWFDFSGLNQSCP